MIRLKSRNTQIPNGLFFKQPEINWDSRKVLPLHPSFSTLVNAVISARRANPHHAKQHGWSLDQNAVGDEVDAFNAKVCTAMGWTKYLAEIGGGAPPPFNQAQSLLNAKQLSAAVGEIKRLWAGVKTVNDWLDSGAPPVAIEHAEKRAAICADCNLNGKGDFSKWFTKPAADAIKRQLERLHERKITTSKDASLQVCEACLCPLKLKVHAPMSFIQPHLSNEVMNDLRNGRNCWIISELAPA
jgi:hypothetical protein